MRARGKQDIHAWHMQIHAFASAPMNGIFHASAHHGHVMPTRREQCMAGKYAVAVLRLFDAV